MKLLILLLLSLGSLIFASKLQTQGSLDLSNQINAQSLFDTFADPAPAAAAAPAAAPAAGTGAAAATSQTKVIKEGWLQLSSMQTLSARKFPMIPLGKDNWAKIEQVRKVMNNSMLNPTQAGTSTPFRKNSHWKIDATVPSDNSFYFRISGLNLYYTETKNDMIVLGAIAVENIFSPSQSQLGDNCFRVTNRQSEKWDLCAANAQEQKAWLCAISGAIGRPCDNASLGAQAGPVIINEKRIIKEPMILIPMPSPVCNEDWNYGSHGSNWNCKCTEGFEQSPINVERRCVSNINDTTSFQWSTVKAANLATFYEDNMLKIRCNSSGGVDCSQAVFGRIIDSDYSEYECREIRFHTPAEHTIEGRKFDLEIQLIFEPTSDGDFKKKAVVAFLAQQGPGKNNRFLEALDLMSLPNVYQPSMALKTSTNDVVDVQVEDLFKDVDDLYEYNGFFNYWKYVGSLTSPPCDEHVRWFLVEKPVHVGYAALSMVKDVLSIPTLGASQADGSSKFVADLNYPKNPDGNNREVMPLRDRSIFYYDAKASNCAPQPVKKPINGAGHYEKVPRKSETYIWVKGDKPSGIEGSFVVPEWEAKGLESPEEQRERDIQNVAASTE